ncbi:helix-turn-helix domain-containing protein [Agrobacterium rhizogenes]|uniref:IclR family transcriptional regulator domain-containing protein n=1 Tax=Rhizobium rhizogenes TaxID=359 RepID=UPI00157163FD|nr:IclR family transcriptional regulator C-terminal domain-containing protein [Rhizobium rhizogenes]NTH16589.1 helix-turn-helix domain-containing protein [Rhizobium rhizogenes]
MSTPTRIEQDDASSESAGNVPGTGLLNKSLDILQYVGETDRRLKFKDLSARTGFSKSTLYRILSALSSRGFITMDRRDQSYILGPKFTSLAGSISRSSELIAISSAALKKIADTYGENVNLGVMNGDIQQAIARWEGRAARAFASALGERKPLYCTGLGKSLLAFQSDVERERLIAQIEFTRYTGNTITSATQLRAEMAVIRARGFAIDDNEIIDGVRCVSVPIHDAAGLAIASISITGPSHRMSNERLFELASVLQSAARSISENLRSNLATKPIMQSGSFAGQPISVHDVQSFEAGAMLLNARNETLYWTDPTGAFVCRLTNTGREVVTWFDNPAHGLCMNAAGDALLTVSDGALWRLTPGGRDATASKLMEAEIFERTRAIHQSPTGSLQVLIADSTSAGTLVAVNDDGTTTLLIEDVSLNAGLTASGEGHVLHALRGRTVLNLDLRDGTLQSVCLDDTVRNDPKDIRGIAVDADGDLWLSHANQWLVTCHRADGSLRFSAPLPVPSPSAMAFNPTTKTMFVGSDRIGLSPNLIELAPLSGGILEIKKPA